MEVSRLLDIVASVFVVYDEGLESFTLGYGY